MSNPRTSEDSFIMALEAEKRATIARERGDVLGEDMWRRAAARMLDEAIALDS